MAGDIGDPAVGRRAIDEGLARFGRIDTLVNNAGLFISCPFTQYTDRQYIDMLSTNLDGFFYTTRQAVEVMEKQGAGHTVNITTSLVDHANSHVRLSSPL
jgi:NAD(P)-dependent dehydrogenase (short-subunit alcohol dehydrogenase family)